MGQGASKPVELRAKCGHFRVLVIGRANAGKTTLLKRVCDTIEDPEIYDVRGKKIDPKVIEASENRGEHDIENELIFKSNPQFIFHDSRGFESGSVKETRKMKNFIRERARTSKLADQLHAIWYCLPTNTNRPLLGAEEDFFNNFDRGTVPVIAVFTKFDGLIDETFAKLLSNGCSYEEAEEWALPQAVETLSTDLEAPLARFEFHPSDCVQMHDMRETGSDCRELIAKTANALNDDTLQMLLISVQRNNIYISVTRATGGGMIQENLRRIIIGILSYFPHFWISKDPYEEDIIDRWASRTWPIMFLKMASAWLRSVRSPEGHHRGIPILMEACTIAIKEKYPEAHSIKWRKDLRSRAELVSGAPAFQPELNLNFQQAICICLEQTFSEAHAEGIQVASAFSKAFDAYHGSALQTTVDGELAVLPWPSVNKIPAEWYSSDLHRNMIEIITTHPLRINSPAA